MGNSSQDSNGNTTESGAAAKLVTEAVPKNKLTIEELSYLPPPAPFYVQQGLREKLISKCKENPFVPLGKA